MKSKSWLILLSNFGVIFWVFSIVVAYYLFHKPISLAQIITVVHMFWQFTVGISIISIAGGLGYLVLGELQISKPVSWVVSSALGLGIFGTAILVFGSIIGVNIYVFIVGFIFVGILIRYSILDYWRLIKPIKFIWVNFSNLERCIIICIFWLGFIALLSALSPPIKFDALVYHLSLPQTFIGVGRIVYTPKVVFWGMPLLGEMIFTASQIFGGVESSTLIGWLIGIVGLFGIFGYSQDKFGTTSGWVSLACLLSGYSLATSLGWGYVDWLTILFSIAIIAVLDHWVTSGATKNLILMGLLTGFLIGTKYSAGVLLVGVLLVIILVRPKNGKFSVISNLFIYLLATCIAMFPWLIKNYWATANPFYPFFFPSGGMDSFRQAFYRGTHAWGTWLDIIALPLRASIIGIEGAPGYGSSIGPLLLGLGAAAWVKWCLRPNSQKTTMKINGLVVLTGILIWAVAGRYSGYLIQSRLYLPIFPAAAILAGAGYQVFEVWEWKGIRFKRIVGALILLVLILNVFQITVVSIKQNSIQAILALQTRQEFVNNNLGWYGPAMEAINHLPDDAYVLMLWEPRSLYCLPKCDPDEIIDRWIHDRHIYREPLDILASWRSEGYTHVLLHDAGAEYIRHTDDRYTESDWKSLEDLLSQLVELVDFGGAYHLYSLVKT